jgi:hypothetical protein
MPSTNTDNLGLEKQATGENDGTWGVRLNALIDLLDKAITEQLDLSVAGSSNITLSSTQYENFCHRYTGILTGDIDVIVPALNRLYLIENATTGAFTLTVKTPAGTGAAVTQGERAFVYCDGTNVVAAISTMTSVADDTAPQLGGVMDTNAFSIEFSEGAAVASATQPDVFGGQDGNTVHVTGTTQIDDFADAPRVGAQRWLVFDDALTITHGAGITIMGAASVTTAAGGVAWVYADAVDAFRLVYFPPGGFPSLSTEQQWTAPQYADVTSIPPAATINVDMSAGNNFEVLNQDQAFTLNFTNIQKGQAGFILIDFDGGGPYALTAGTGVKTINGGEGIAMGGAADGKNLLSYYAYAADAVALVNAPGLA